MTTFYLIRHAENDLVGNAIAGRRPGVHLNETGRAQAQRLAERLATRPIGQIFSSPLERARETAEPLARKLGLEIQVSPALIEINFGDWTGKTFTELDTLPEFRQWNTFRSLGRTPGGESMLQVQARIVGELETLRRRYPGGAVAIFSHGDLLRSAVAYYLGLSLDFLLRLEISPASVSIVAIEDWSVRLCCFNLELGGTEPAPFPVRALARKGKNGRRKGERAVVGET